MAVVDQFIKEPDFSLLETLSKEQLNEVAAHYGIHLSSEQKRKKHSMLSAVTTGLVEKGIIPKPTTPVKPKSPIEDSIELPSPLKEPSVQPRLEEPSVTVQAPPEPVVRPKVPTVAPPEPVVRPKAPTVVQPKLLKPKEDVQTFDRKVQDHEYRMQELLVRREELAYRREELKLQAREQELASQVEIARLQFTAKQEGVDLPITLSQTFDVARNIKLVPPFQERDVDRYFVHFERVALSLGWPKSMWPLLLQSVLTGKAQESYSALSLEQSADYEVVKSTILRAYELVPEAYRLRFRRLRKNERQTFVEFAREKERLFDRWCASQSANDFDKLREVMLIEEFKNCLPDSVVVYLCEQKPTTLEKAAILADEYSLTHRVAQRDRPRNAGTTNLAPERASNRKTTSQSTSAVECFYCKRTGHIVAECPVLKKKQAKPTALVSTKKSPLCLSPNEHDCVDNDLAAYKPFVRTGWVSVPGSDSKPEPVKILRDTGASQSFVLEGVLPLSNKTATNSNVLVRGIGMNFIQVPLHKIQLKSDLVSGCFVVGVRPSLPVPGVSFILGNDIGQGDIWEKSIAPPEVVSVPLSSDVDECAQSFPEVFPSCAVTRSMAQQGASQTSPAAFDDLQNTFFANLDKPETHAVVQTEKKEQLVAKTKVPLSREKLISSQNSDESLTSLMDSAASSLDEVMSPHGYFLRDGVLMRKWQPHVALDDQVFCQIVVPVEYRGEVLHLAHDAAAGHLGVTKTYDRILRHFYWPGLKKDVRRYCKTCHVCQLVGKPNQKVPPAPLYPVPVINDPFEHIIIDCVGPLARSSSGYRYLFTLMCANTRFPEAVPLARITTKTVTKALIRFFSLFEMARKHLQSTQTKMKKRYDAKAKHRVFEPGDKVLVLLPVPGSSLESRFSGPYVVERKVSDRDYVIKMPERRLSSRLCHINMLKRYFDRETEDKSLSNVLKSDLPSEPSIQSAASPVMLSSLVAAEVDDLTDPSRSVTVGRLKNSEMLKVLPEHLSYLSPTERHDIQQLIREFPQLFNDAPSLTNVLEHDIDVGSATPIQQHPYRAYPITV